MFYPVLFIGYYRIDIDIFNTSENALFNIRIGAFERPYQFLCLLPFRMILPVVAGRAGIGKLAGALYKMQIVIVAPRLYIVLPYEVKRTYKLHTLVICAA